MEVNQLLFKKLIEDNLSDAPILYYESKAYSYRELYTRSLSLGQLWINNGAKYGDRIIIACSNKAECVIALLACFSYGFVFVPIEPNNGDESYIANDCGSIFTFSGGLPDYMTEKARPVLPMDTIGYIIYTSGSTNKPKGVVAPFLAIDFCIEAINERLCNNETDKILSRLSLSFDYGLYQVLLALRFKSELVLIDNETPLLTIPQILYNHQITALPVVPTMLSALCRSRLLKSEYCPNLRYICSTGEILNVDLISNVRNALPNTAIIPMYGLTECKRVSIMPPDRWDKVMAGSCGLPLNGTEVKILDESEGEGELVVYGPNIMNGYWGDETTSAEVFCMDENGRRYLRTGDAFSFDDDGFLYFRRRIKNMIKVGGHAVSGIEIEEFLKCVDGAIDIRVVGIPDDIYGESVCACVYSDQADIINKIEEISKCLPVHKQIRRIVLFNQPFPTNKNGKIDYTALRKKAGES